MFLKHLSLYRKTIIQSLNNFGGARLYHTKFSSDKSVNLGSIPNNMKPLEGDPKSQLKYQYSQFMAVFPIIVQDLTDYTSEHDKTKMSTKHLEHALHYNISNGKKIRGLTSLNVFKKLIGEENLTLEIVRMGHILGWCMEILHSDSLIIDDILDKSEKRRNKLCWYKLDYVQSIAINDSLMLRCAINFIIKKYFHHLPQYVDMIEFLNESVLIAGIGESLGFCLSRDISQFSMDAFKYLTFHKTSYLSFYTPIAMSMLLAEYKDQKTIKFIKTICNEFGYFFQIRNDYRDLFSGNDMLSKPGTDIEEGKCTWLAVYVMEHGTEQQKQILRQCYGQNDSESIERVKRVYKDMNFPQLYREYEKNATAHILKLIADIDNSILRDIMFGMLNDIHTILSAANHSEK